MFESLGVAIPLLLLILFLLIACSAGWLLLLFLNTTRMSFWSWPKKEAHSTSQISAGQEAEGNIIEREYHWAFPVRGNFRWKLSKRRFQIKLRLNKDRYFKLKGQPRDTNASHFDQYVTPQADEVKKLAEQLTNLAVRQGYQPYEHLCNVITFIQQAIQYKPDLSPDTGAVIEHPKYPLETLVDQNGDCEDQVILAAAVLHSMGYEVALLILPTHVALGVTGVEDLQGTRLTHGPTRKKYFFVETTVVGWLPGEVPKEFKTAVAGQDYEILPII